MTPQKILLLPLLALIAVASISGCSSSDERPVYQGAQYYKNLEYPPDLSAPDTTDELKIPEPTETALQRFRDNNELETTITPKFDGIRMVSYAGDSWVEVDNDVEHVWPRLKAFFEGEGIELVDVRPMLGYMETEWTTKFSPEQGFFRSVFQNFEPDQKHKFRVRVERFEDGNKTRVHIAHRQIEKHIKGEFADDIHWRTITSDVEVEREMLSRMALFAGLDPQQRIALLENYRPYASLVRLDKNDRTSIMMTGSLDFVWRRTVRALDRMQMKNIRQDQSASTIYFTVDELDDQALGVKEGEEDEIAKSSWLMQMFTGEDDEPEGLKGRYRLELLKQTSVVQIKVRDDASTINVDEDGYKTSTARVEQIRNYLARNLD